MNNNYIFNGDNITKQSILSDDITSQSISYHDNYNNLLHIVAVSNQLFLLKTHISTLNDSSGAILWILVQVSRWKLATMIAKIIAIN